MHNPAHPGEVLREWLPEGMTVTEAAKELQVSRVTLSNVLNGKAGVTRANELKIISKQHLSSEVSIPSGVFQEGLVLKVPFKRDAGCRS